MRYYTKVIELISKNIAKNPYIKKVIQIGSINYPGISDIDFILVAYKAFNYSQFKKCFSTKEFPLKLRVFYNYLFCHPPLIVFDEILTNMKYLFPIFNYKTILGADDNEIIISKEMSENSKLFIIIDLIIRDLPRQFLIPLLSKRINCRVSLLKLNQLNLLIQLFKEIYPLNDENFNNYKKNLCDLRSTWFKNSKEQNEEMILEQILDALHNSFKLIELINHYLNQNDEIERNLGNNSPILFKGRGYETFFIDNLSMEKSLLLSYKIHQETQNICTFLPKNLSITLLKYSNFNNRFSNYIKANLSNISLKVLNTFKNNEIEKRNFYINKHLDWLFRNNFPFGFFHDFGFFNNTSNKPSFLQLYRKYILELFQQILLKSFSEI